MDSAAPLCGRFGSTSQGLKAGRTALGRTGPARIHVDIVDQQGGRTGRLINRPAAAEGEVHERIERAVEFRWGGLAPDRLSVKKEHKRLWRDINPKRMKVLYESIVGEIDL